MPADENLNCLNCGTRLRGQYCGHCGQRSRNQLISIWQLTREAFGDLFELDSRLWRTVIPLLIRPGQLTRDYLEGRRARYMPPFRTYLVLSVIFFLVAFFDPREDLGLLFDPPPESSAEEIAAQEAAAERMLPLDTGTEQLGAQAEIDAATAPELADRRDHPAVDSGTDDNAATNPSVFSNCDKASISGEDDIPEWVKTRFADARLQQICERNKARGNENMADAIIDNVPVALIVLLPFMAIALKILYPLSRRYFVEHLLFFVHFHAFFFLILTLQILFERLLAKVSLQGNVSTAVLVATSFYVPVYLYRAMRHVYGQGHLLTIFKYIALIITYLLGATLTLFSAFLVAVLSA